MLKLSITKATQTGWLSSLVDDIELDFQKGGSQFLNWLRNMLAACCI